MSDWIDEAAKDMIADSQKASTINLINFWASLRAQIEHDVAKMNRVLVGNIPELRLNPISVKDTLLGFEILKVWGSPIRIGCQNLVDRVVIDLSTYTSDGEQTRQTVYAVKAANHGVVLTNNVNTFIIPEQASQHILEPILNGLKAAA